MPTTNSTTTVVLEYVLVGVCYIICILIVAKLDKYTYLLEVLLAKPTGTPVADDTQT